MEYRYDAWGRQTSKTGPKANSLGTINPFRYRGYVLDEDVGLYYLRSRYYNPWWGRFISADSILGHVGSLLQHNLFAYCGNSPLIHVDVDGKHMGVIDGENTGDGVSGIGLIAFPVTAGFAAKILIDNAFRNAANISASHRNPVTTKDATDDKEEDVPDVTYPGDDPEVAPGKDYEWRGKPPIGGDRGAWKNPKTGEQWHPDLKHKPPIGPHWDYQDPMKRWWRVMPNSRIYPKVK